MRRFPWVFALLLASATVADAGRDRRAQAVQLAEDSEKAYKAGHFEHAADLLRKAHGLYPEPILLYNLGRALEGMGDAKNAVAAYEDYLHDAKQIDDRGAIERRIATLKAQIARDLTPPPPDDTKPPPDDTKPPPDDTQPPPPEHETPLPALTVPVPTPEVHDTGDDGGGSSFLPWATIGTGSAIVLTGALYGWRASQNHDDAVNEPTQQKALDLQNAATRDATIANVLFAVGGAVVIGGAVWEYFHLKQSGGTPSQAARLHVAPNGIAVEWTLP